MIKFVVGKGIDINAEDQAGRTALHLAVESHVTEAGGRVAHREVVQALLDAGADLNRKNGRGETALQLIRAAVPPQPEVLRLLVEHGAK
jgi:ankyrin repeat protein